MSLPSIKDLVNLKDLGKIVYDVKGVFPFVLNEKQMPAFEQKWMDILNYEAFTSDLAHQDLLIYTEEPVATDPVTAEINGVNQITEENPTEFGIELGNTFRKGIEGVYRLVEKYTGYAGKGVDSIGFPHEISIFPDEIAQLRQPGYTKQYYIDGIILPIFDVEIVAPVVNMAHAEPVIHVEPAAVRAEVIADADVEGDGVDHDAALGHRGNIAQQVILDEVKHDNDLDKLLESFSDLMDIDTLEALLDDTQQPVTDLPPTRFEDIKPVDLPPAPLSIDTQEVDEDYIDSALVEELLAEENNLEVTQPSEEITGEEAQLPPAVPPRDESFEVTSEDLTPAEATLPPPLPPRPVVVIETQSMQQEENADDELATELEASVDTDTREAVSSVVDLPSSTPVTEEVVSDQVDLPSSTPVTEEVVSDQIDLTSAGTEIQSDDDMDEAFVRELLDESINDLSDELTTQVSNDISSAVTAETQVSEIVEPSLTSQEQTVDVATDTLDILDATPTPLPTMEPLPGITDNAGTDGIDQAVVDALLNEVPETPAFIPPPPPPPLPPNGKMGGAIKTRVEGAVESTDHVQPKKNINAGKPQFAFQGDDFAAQWNKMKAKAAENRGNVIASDEVVATPPKKASSFLQDLLSGAIQQSNDPKGQDPSVKPHELTEWDIEQIQEDNQRLISQQAREVAKEFDANALINGILASKEQSIRSVVDAYEQKLKTSNIIATLSSDAQQNDALQDGVIDAANLMQRKMVADTKVYATAAIVDVIEDHLADLMIKQFNAKVLQSEISLDALQTSLHEKLGELPENVLKNIYTAAANAIDEIVAAEQVYVNTNKIPESGFCNKVVGELAGVFERAKSTLTKIIADEGLKPEVESTEQSEVKPSWTSFLLGKFLGRQKAMNGNDGEDEIEADTKDVDDSEGLAATEGTETSETTKSNNLFSFGGIKNFLMGALGGGTKTSDSKTNEDTSDEEVDYETVNELLDSTSPVSSGYLSASSDTVGEVNQTLNIADVIDNGSVIPGAEGSGLSAVSPVIAQQLLTDSHDSANGGVFG